MLHSMGPLNLISGVVLNTVKSPVKLNGFLRKCEFSLRINVTGLLPCCGKKNTGESNDEVFQDLKRRTTANTTVSATCVFNKLPSDNLEQTIIKT